MKKFCPIGKFRLLRIQLQLDAVPLPNEIKFTLSVEDSKLTRLNCGLAPPWVNVTLFDVTVRFCNAAVSLLKRAKDWRGSPPTLSKKPPTTIFPSCNIARERTIPCEGSFSITLGLNESAS